MREYLDKVGPLPGLDKRTDGTEAAAARDQGEVAAAGLIEVVVAKPPAPDPHEPRLDATARAHSDISSTAETVHRVSASPDGRMQRQCGVLGTMIVGAKAVPHQCFLFCLQLNHSIAWVLIVIHASILEKHLYSKMLSLPCHLARSGMLAI